MKRWLLRSILGAIVLVSIVYAADYCVLRYRVSRSKDAFGQVIVRPLYAIQEKGGKVEYQTGDPETDVCVYSLFPHMGYSTCWYLSRHTEKRINI
jgi:hypothetical protein